MGLYSPLPFSPGYDFKAQKSFTYDGVDYFNGDTFPKVGQEKPNDRLLEKMYVQRRIVPIDPRDPDASIIGNKHGGKHAKRPAEMVTAAQPPVDNAHVEDGATEFTPDEVAANAAPEVAADAVEPAPAADAPETVEPAPDAAPEPAAGLQKVHKGFGKYDVLDVAGTVLASDLTKAAADAMIA